MKDAKAQSEHESATEGGSQPMQSAVLGKAEKVIGDATGCEGMSKEGVQRMGAGSEEGSGTG